MARRKKAASAGREDLLSVLQTLEQVAKMVSDAREQLRRFLPPPTEVIPLPASTKRAETFNDLFDSYLADLGGRREEAEAHRAGAVVRAESLQGKGNVVRRMFADIQADVYVLVDGDDTYDASMAPEMVRLMLEQHLDMVSGARIKEEGEAYRRGHRLGNAVLTGMVRWLFGKRITDVLSGYRVFSRRFVKSFPALATGFETETEFSVHALELRMPIAELLTSYRGRLPGSASKLRTYVDGWRILRTIVLLVKEERPLQFFSFVGVVVLAVGLGIGIPIVMEFMQTGLVPRLPTGVLATGLALLSFQSFGCGLILDSVARGRKEIKRLAYLDIPELDFPD